MTRYIIGDIHGCIHEFTKMIEKIAPQPSDTVIIAGDLIDRGPDSVGCIRYATRLAARTNLVLIEGNHEYKHRRYRSHISTGAKIAAKMARGKPELDSITKSLTDQDIHFLESAVPGYRDSELGFTVVHAGIAPTLREVPIVGPLTPKSTSVLFVRHIDPHGNAVEWGRENDGSRFWAEAYDGRFGHVYFGHQVFLEPNAKQFEHATGLDLGCVFGGRLACAIIDESGVDFAYVKAAHTYKEIKSGRHVPEQQV